MAPIKPRTVTRAPSHLQGENAFGVDLASLGNVLAQKYLVDGFGPECPTESDTAEFLCLSGKRPVFGTARWWIAELGAGSRLLDPGLCARPHPPCQTGEAERLAQGCRERVLKRACF